VLQGEREMAHDNRSLGRFILDGIPSAPRGTPQIEVTFDIDANGILSVGAKDNASGKEQSIRIEGSSGLDKSEIDQLVDEAQAHAQDDKERRERIDARNGLDALVYDAQKTVDEHREKIPVSDLSALEGAITSGKALVENEDATLDELRSHHEQLQAAAHKVSEALYKQADSDAAPAADDAPDASGEDVVDAEFTEEK